MGPKRKQSGKKRFTEEEAKALLKSLGHVIVSSKDRFHYDLANNMENAWATRSSERFLYTVFSHIISHLCDTILPPQFPTSTISHTPQVCFRSHEPPLGEPAEKINKKDLHPEQIPDFARMVFTFTDSPTSQSFTILRRLIDFWEIKGLNVAERWDTELARSKAAEAIERHIEQVWKQARAAFAYNESWTVVYALLIIGPYFSQLVWQRPPGIVEPPTPDLSKSSTTSTLALLENYNARIKEAKARDVPRIEFYNAPVFDFANTEDSDGRAQEVFLSAHFRYALSLPMKEQFDDCEIQTSWFDPPSHKPDPMVQEGDPEIDLDAVVREALITKCVTTLEGRRGAEFPSSSSAHDSLDEDTHDFELSLGSKRILKALEANPLSSPIPTNRQRRQGVGAANRPQPPSAQRRPRRAAHGGLLLPRVREDGDDGNDEGVEEGENNEDDEDHVDEEVLLDQLQELGLNVHDAGDEEDDYADNEETEGDDD